MKYRVLVSLIMVVSLVAGMVVSVGATGNSPTIVLADEYYAVDLMEGAHDFQINGNPADAPGAESVAGSQIDFSWSLGLATYVDYVVVTFVLDSTGPLPNTVSAAPFQGNFESASPVQRDGDLYQATILFRGIVPAGITIRFAFDTTVYAPIHIQSCVGYISDTVVDNVATRIDYRPYVETNTSTAWSTLTQQSLPWGKSFTGYRDPMSDYSNTLRSGIDLAVHFDQIPVRWASKAKFTFSFPYRFVEDPDTKEWYSSDDWFEFGIFVDKSQSAEGSYYPDVTVTKNLEYADNSVGDYAPWMVYTFTVDLSDCDLAYTKFNFNCRFYGFGVAGSTSTNTPVLTECTLSPVTYYVAPPPSDSWLSSLLSAIKSGFDSIVDKLSSLFESDAVQESADNLQDSMGQVDDFLGNQEQVFDNYVPTLILDANDVIYRNANAFSFVGSVLSRFAGSLMGWDIVLTLPIVIGILLALVQRVPGATSSIRAKGGDD